MARNRKPVSARGNTAQSGTAQPAAQHGPAHPVPVSRENADHYRWGKDCDAWYLVKDDQLHVIEELMPPGAAEIRHHHQRAQQFFFILSGEILMEIEGETVLVAAGSGIRVLPGARHQIRNPSSSPVRVLVVSQPPSHGDRIDD
jgi:mannose-6-phosphate isomerase-like protein (cupin superfamily)